MIWKSRGDNCQLISSLSAADQPPSKRLAASVRAGEDSESGDAIDFVLDRGERRHGIGGLRDGPADDEIVGAGAEGLDRCEAALLIILRGAVRTYARRDELEVRTETRALAARAEHTTPSSPACCVRPARRATCSSMLPLNPISCRSDSFMLVSTVTPIRSGRGVTPLSAACAARNIALPPEAGTFTIHAPRSAAAFTACATVWGMSWNYRSRNTSKPRPTNCRSHCGPPRVNNSLPTLTRQCRGSSPSAIAMACLGSA